MKLIRRYSQQKYFNPRQFFKKKGYQMTRDFHLLRDHIQINKRWSEIWTLHLGDGEANYILVKEKEEPYQVYIIDIEESLVSSGRVKYLLENHEAGRADGFVDYLE